MKSKVVRIICFALVIFALFAFFTSCNKQLTQEEMRELANKASEYFDNGKFEEGIETYQELYDGGCREGDYFGFPLKTAEEALETRKGNAMRASIACEYAGYAVHSLQEQLKDPDSLVIHSISLKGNGDQITMTLDYGAKNSFGGTVRDTYERTYRLGKYYCGVVYETLKDWMDSRGATEADAGRYLAGNVADFHEKTVYQAIVEGTVTKYLP